MKIFIYCRPRDYTREDILYRFVQILDRSGLEYGVNEVYTEHVYNLLGLRLPSYGHLTEKDLAGGAIMISIGGDGTFLDAVRNLRGLPMPIMGVNGGRLGFLASVTPGQFATTLGDIKNGNYIVGRRSMVTAEGDFPSTPDFPHALNEITVHRHTADMIEVAASVDGHTLPIIRGDGSIISTPTGSTAYSLSAGGPLLSPECKGFILSGIAPHNFSIRPLVVPDDSIIEWEVRTRGREVLISLDNSSFIVGDGARFTIRKSNYHTFFAQTQNISFFDTLRDKIMWGLDKRDSAVEKFWIDI